MPDPAAVNSMFGRIAHRYDLANRVLSGGIDIYWRSKLVSAVRRAQPSDVLDVATGSGDVALALERGLPEGARIVGMDFCEPMLREAEAKRGRRPSSRVSFLQCDALALPMADGSFDAVTIAFGLRNMADRSRCLAEMRRVLRPAGVLFILEFSQPWSWFRPLFGFHMRRTAPALAGFLTGDRGAYDYLRESIGAFPSKEALSREILGAGFTTVSARAMTLGVVALHVARR
jgi:demethylmenaquinone methyltransferase/2-methoxy-6-polyprenyl-1,4-benzoquinol methylase